MTHEEAIAQITACTATPLKRGDIVILATNPEKLNNLGLAIETIQPVLRAAGITVLIMSDEMGLVVVPEARRVLPIPTTGAP